MSTETDLSSDISLEQYSAIRDVEVALHAELDRRTISVRDLLELEIDSILPLSRAAGENIDVYAEDVLIGSAELLVNDETLAVRIADLCAPGSVSDNRSRKSPAK